jgi:formate dehydrogenase major subunit
MAAGKKAARIINDYLSGQSLGNTTADPHARTNKTTSSFTSHEIDDFKIKKRQVMPKLSLSARQNNFNEVELGFTENMAVKEAQRCLRCWM